MRRNKIIVIIITLMTIYILLMIRGSAMPNKERDVLLMAKTIVGEARGESWEGKLAVAHVIMNRLKAGGWYGSTIPQVINKPYQFSCWNKKDINRAIASKPEKHPDESAWQECQAAAKLVYEGKVKDNTRGATHYLTHHRFMRICKSYTDHWLFNVKPVCIIGEHIFFIEAEDTTDYSLTRM